MWIALKRERPKSVFFSLLFFILIWTPASFAAELKVHFIDVGQGDSILVVAPSGKKLLIDAGIHAGKDHRWNPFNYIRKLKQSGEINDLDIEYAVITHPHDDHYGGFNYLCSMDPDKDDFKVAHIYYSVYKQSSYGKFWNCLQIIQQKASNHSKISVRGPPIDLGDGIEINILHPFKPINDPSEDKNDDSVVIKIKYKNVSFLLTGDASANVERLLLHKDLRSNVLKLGHHGSNTASCEEFIQKVEKRDLNAVVSVNCKDGKGKTYGHPNSENLATLRALKKVDLFRTDLHGSIVFVTDGDSLQAYPAETDFPETKLWKPGVKSRVER